MFARLFLRMFVYLCMRIFRCLFSAAPLMRQALTRCEIVQRKSRLPRYRLNGIARAHRDLDRCARASVYT